MMLMLMRTDAIFMEYGNGAGHRDGRILDYIEREPLTSVWRAREREREREPDKPVKTEKAM